MPTGKLGYIVTDLWSIGDFVSVILLLSIPFGSNITCYTVFRCNVMLTCK